MSHRISRASTSRTRSRGVSTQHTVQEPSSRLTLCRCARIATIIVQVQHGSVLAAAGHAHRRVDRGVSGMGGRANRADTDAAGWCIDVGHHGQVTTRCRVGCGRDKTFSRVGVSGYYEGGSGAGR